MEVFYLVKTIYVHLLSVVGVVIKGVFGGYLLVVVIKSVYLTGGKIFLWEKSYMLICEYIYKI
jgi:hypothetical protein